jgi:hypothetical protein
LLRNVNKTATANGAQAPMPCVLSAALQGLPGNPSYHAQRKFCDDGELIGTKKANSAFLAFRVPAPENRPLKKPVERFSRGGRYLAIPQNAGF